MSRQMLVLEVCCPQCGAALTEGMKIPLDAYVKDTNQQGVMRLSAVFGDYTVESDVEAAEGSLIEFRCPKCDSTLMLPLTCKLCAAPMASLNLVRGGYVEFCSRLGCKGHALGGVGDIDDMMNLMNRMFETPYD